MVDPLPPDMLDIPASVIEQIPLGVQVIDLASLRASDRPQGQSLYPDSIIPVSSFTHGQHPDTGSAQTVETDGNHALKVAVSGGGSAGKPYKQQHSAEAGAGGYNQFYMPVSGSGSGDYGPIGTINVLYACQFIGAFTARGGTLGGISTIQLYPLPDQLVGLDLLSIPTIAGNADFPSASPNFSQFIQFGPGIDMNATFPGNTGFELWWYGFNALHGTGILTLYYE